MAADPNKRFDAAQAVFKSREAAALPALDKALAAETNARVKQALAEARAAIIVTQADASRRRQDRGHRGDPRPRRPGRARPARRACRPTCRRRCGTAARAAIAKIQSTLALWSAVQNAWYGLSLGSVLLLAAIGLAITFGVMGVINMAHGEMVMLGAYTTFVVQEIIRTQQPGAVRLFAVHRACRSPSWSPAASAS